MDFFIAGNNFFALITHIDCQLKRIGASSSHNQGLIDFLSVFKIIISKIYLSFKFLIVN